MTVPFLDQKKQPNVSRKKAALKNSFESLRRIVSTMFSKKQVLV